MCLRLARTSFAFCLALALMVSSGCTLFAPRPLDVPDEMGSAPAFAALAEGPASAQLLSEAFRPFETLRFSSRIHARRYRFLGVALLDSSLIFSAPEELRMIVRKPGDQTTLLDLLVAGGNLSVHIPLADSLFTGPVPAEGSPLRRHFGVEPWDLLSVLAIGQRLSQMEFEVERHRKYDRLRVNDPSSDIAQGLQYVDIERATGLPTRALWRRGSARWNVDYRRWIRVESDEAAASDRARSWIMPSEFVITGRRPRVRLEIGPRQASAEGRSAQYRINPRLSPRAFKLRVPPHTAVGGLDEIDEALSEL